MWAMVMAVISPSLQYPSHVIEGGKLMDVQQLMAELAVERFDEAVLDRLAWPEEVELHAAQVAPLVEHLEANSAP